MEIFARSLGLSENHWNDKSRSQNGPLGHLLFPAKLRRSNSAYSQIGNSELAEGSKSVETLQSPRINHETTKTVHGYGSITAGASILPTALKPWHYQSPPKRQTG